jgi:hypothetical protein
MTVCAAARLAGVTLALLSVSGCCCDVLVFLPIPEVRAAPVEHAPTPGRTPLLDGTRGALHGRQAH